MEAMTATTEVHARVEAPPAKEARGPWALGIALAVAMLYAAFANGAIGLADSSRLQLGVAVLALGTVAALLFHRGGLRLSAATSAWMGLGLLALFAGWVGLSMTWSIAPDASWAEMNRAISYVLIVLLAICLGSSLPRAPQRVAVGYLAVAFAIALYALGGKLVPWLNVPGLFDLNHTGDFARLRAPVGYWNALALIVALAVPTAMRAAADEEFPRRWRLAFLGAFVPLTVCVGLTYSRGGALVAIAGIALVAIAGPDRLRLLLLAAAGGIGAAPAMLAAFFVPDLSSGGVPVADRTVEGAGMLVLLLFGIAAAVFLGGMILAREERLTLGARSRKLGTRIAMGVAAGALLIAIVATSASDRGLSGSLAQQQREFTVVQGSGQDDPGRLLEAGSTNRADWWQEAVGAFSEKPAQGHGAGSFPLLHLAFRENQLEVRQAHSVPLQFLAEVGAVGAVLGLGGLLLLGFAALGRLRIASGRDRLYTVLLGAGAAVWSIHMFVDWDWEIPAATMPMLVFLGVLAAKPIEHADPDAPRRRVGAWTRAALLFGAGLAFVAIALSTLLPWISDHRTSEAAAAASRGTPKDLDEAARLSASAADLNPAAIEPLFIGAAVAERRNQFARASELIHEAIERQPDNPAVWVRAARFETLAGNYQAGLRSAERFAELDPFNGFARIVFGERDVSDASATATGTPLPRRLKKGEQPKTPAPGAPGAIPGIPAIPGLPGSTGGATPTPGGNDSPIPPVTGTGTTTTPTPEAGEEQEGR